MQRGDLVPAIANSAASLFGSLLAAYLGIVLARLIG
jgi:fluoride ion exporter CrcB/FEX